MKKILCFIVLFSVSSFAADLNLNGGESAIINASVDTKVTCGLGGKKREQDCDSKTKALSVTLASCMTQQNVAWCVPTLWPTWKNANSLCLTEGISVCVENCMKQQNAPWCIQTCK